MKLIVGLGNPDKEYEKTRHNVGFMAIDAFVGKEKWNQSKKSKILYYKCGEVELIKPQTFMNLSGQAVAYAAKKHNLASNEILVIHDDIDLDLGKIKLSFNSGSAGNKGVQSIINHLKTKEFWRLRIGIGPKRGDASKFVLKRFSRLQQPKLKKTIKQAIQAIEQIIADGPEKTQNEVNAN